jgi:hypothetical protein
MTRFKIILLYAPGSFKRPFPFGFLYKMDPFSPRHGVPQVSGGGDGLQICKTAANLLNKQSRTSEKGGPLV